MNTKMMEQIALIGLSQDKFERYEEWLLPFINNIVLLGVLNSSHVYSWTEDYALGQTLKLIDKLEIPENIKITSIDGPIYHDEELDRVIQVETFMTTVKGEDVIGAIDSLVESLNHQLKNSTHLYLYSGCRIHNYTYNGEVSTRASVRWSFLNTTDLDIQEVI